MIKLKVERKLQYMSPSSLSNSEKQPNKFYLQRLVEDRLPRDPQGIPAAIGSAVDVLIKQRLMDNGVRPEKRAFVEDTLKDSVENEEFKEEAFEIAKRVTFNYAMEAIAQTDFRDIEIHENFLFNPLNDGGIRLLGKLDCTYFDELMEVEAPHDLKCNGLNPANESTVSPKPGYYAQFKGRQQTKFGHKKYRIDIPMEEIDYGWATQLCTYGWLMGLSPKLEDSFPCRIDQITKNKAGEFLFTLFRGMITPRFQREVYDRYAAMWYDIECGHFVKRLASRYDRNAVFTMSTTESWF